MASPIKSRYRWVCIEIVLASLLIWLVISPGRPVRIWQEVRQTAPVHYLHARLIEYTLNQRIMHGDLHARLELATRRASTYRLNRYIDGDPVGVLQPLLDAGDTEAWETLFWIGGRDDPALVTRAALAGVADAQDRLMADAGVLDSPSQELMYLYRMQDSGPGWLQRFNRYYYSLLLKQAAGDKEADSLIRMLLTMNSGTPATSRA